MSTAEELKAKGNAAFQAGKNEEAVNWFTQAIEKDSGNHVLYSNRSAAYSNDKKFGNALRDAEKTVELKPEWAKGYSRMAAAHHGLERFQQAIEAAEKGLKIDPQNQPLTEAKQSAIAALRSKGMPPMGGMGGMGGPGADGMGNMLAQVFGPNALMQIGLNPKLRGFLEDEDYKAKIAMIQKNPETLQMLMQTDKRIQTTLMELLGVQAGGPADEEEAQEERNRQERARRKKEEEAAKKKAEEEAANTPEALAKKEVEEKANVEKTKGNDFYKQKKFTEALECYDRALEIDPDNFTIKLNKAAVYMEQKEYESCHKACDAVVEEARSKRAELSVVAKAISRNAACYHREGNLEEAIRQYKVSLTENRSADTLNKLQKVEKEKRDADVKAYLDPEKALEAKERGNALFKVNKYPEAIKEYSEAIKRDPSQPLLRSNRAAAYMKLMEYQGALDDCMEGLKVDPNCVKLIVRAAQCYFFRKEYHNSFEWYEKGLHIDPENKDCKDGMDQTLYQVQKANSSGEVDEDRQRKAMADPAIQRIMQDPAMSQVLKECSEDPSALGRHMKHPGVAEKIRKLMFAGVLRTG